MLFGGNTDGAEKPPAHVFVQRFAGALFHCRAQEAAANGVVQKSGAGLMDDGLPQKIFYPALVHLGHPGHSHRHAHQVGHLKLAHVLVRLDAVQGKLVGEHIHKALVGGNQPLRAGQAKACAGVALAEGVVGMGLTLAVGPQVGFAEHLAVALHHNAVNFVFRAVQQAEALFHGAAVQADFLRAAHALDQVMGIFFHQ